MNRLMSYLVFSLACAGLARAEEEKLSVDAKLLQKVEQVSAETADLKADQPKLIEFWATWCPPCVASIPHMNEVYEALKDEKISIVAVTNYGTKESLRKFIKDKNMKYPVALEKKGELAKSLKVSGIPVAFLVDKDGKVVWKGHPMGLKVGDIRTQLNLPAPAAE